VTQHARKQRRRAQKEIDQALELSSNPDSYPHEGGAVNPSLFEPAPWEEEAAQLYFWGADHGGDDW